MRGSGRTIELTGREKSVIQMVIPTRGTLKMIRPTVLVCTSATMGPVIMVRG